MVRVVITNPAELGPSWRKGAEHEVSADRAARWLARGWAALPPAPAPAPAQPQAEPPVPPAPEAAPVTPPAPPAAEPKSRGGRRRR